MANLTDIIDVDTLTQKAQSAYDEVVNKFDDYSFEEDRAQYRVETLGSGAAGIYQAKEIINAFDIPIGKEDGNTQSDEEYIEEFGWEIVEDYFNDIGSQIQSEIKLQTKPGYEDYTFWFGNDENDGDYCLYIGVDRNDVSAEEELSPVIESKNYLVNKANLWLEG